MKETHWAIHATQWSLLGQPLLPGAEDVAAFERYVGLAAAGKASPRALVLGVTPELMGMRWPPLARITGCDRLLDMIVRRRRNDADQVVCADWLRLPFACCSHDVVIGDNSLNVLSGPDVLRAFVAELHRVLRPGGWLILRISMRPEKSETIQAIIEDLEGGAIGSFHAFKWRLAMALHDRPDMGVRLADVWSTWRARIPEPDALMHDLGWDPKVVKTIDVYRDVQSRYTFPTMSEASVMFGSSFEVHSVHVGGYELGERCPIVAMRRRPAGESRASPDSTGRTEN